MRAYGGDEPASNSVTEPPLDPPVTECGR
jgi:hypothetical protein